MFDILMNEFVYWAMLQSPKKQTYKVPPKINVRWVSVPSARAQISCDTEELGVNRERQTDDKTRPIDVAR